jgi:hypothetical protein
MHVQLFILAIFLQSISFLCVGDLAVEPRLQKNVNEAFEQFMDQPDLVREDGDKPIPEVVNSKFAQDLLKDFEYLVGPQEEKARKKWLKKQKKMLEEEESWKNI